MRTDFAYRSSAPEVVEAWEAYKAYHEEVRLRRVAMQDRYGRGLMVRGGWGHQSEVVGLAPLDGDSPGDVVGENGELRYPLRGYDMLTPNLRRKAGKDLAAEFQSTLRLDRIELPGMPSWGFFGLRVVSPEIFGHNGKIYARWGDEPSPTGEQWEQIPLSTYYAAHEAYDSKSATV